MKINVSLGWAFIMLVFDSSVEDNKLCTNIECLEGKLKHAAADQISDICILNNIGHINYNTLKTWCFNLFPI